MDWWEKPEEQWTPDDKMAARRAHFRTFLLPRHGRQVLAYMKYRARNVDKDAKLISADTSFALAILFLDDFIRDTRRLCGPQDEMTVLLAECRAAVGKNDTQETTENDIEGYAPDA